MTKVALSGAGGQLGSFLRKTLAEKGVDLRSGAHKPLAMLRPDEDVCHGDLKDADAVDELLDGVDVLLHYAGTSVERPMPEIADNNLVALYAVYEGARRHGVKRVLFASSNHAIGMHSVDTKLTLDCDFRPDGLYGLSKMWGEGMARLYFEKHGIESVCVRIGSALPRPKEFRHLSTWFGLEDFLEFNLRTIDAKKPGYVVAWGCSNNTRAYWTPTACAAIGYQPRQNAEDYAAEILAQKNPIDPIGQLYQGGTFASYDFTPQEKRKV